MSLNLKFNRAFDKAEGIEILDFGTGAELGIAFASHRDIGIAAKRAFLHVAIANTEIHHHLVQLFHVGHRLLGRAQIRLGDDFQQRRPGPIEVDTRQTLEILMQRLASVFFQMSASDADHLADALIQINGQLTLLHDGQFVLADLIALGQIGIKIILAGKDRAAGDFGTDSQAEHCRHAHRLPVQHGQHARHPQIDGASLRIRLGAVSGGRPGENLALGGELGVDFQPDNRFPFHHVERP